MDELSNKSILISAGEASGDMHAANLAREVTKNHINIKFYGMGSSEMKKAGVDLIVDASKLSLIGGLEIITKFTKILRAYLAMKRAIYKDKPDLLILVDYPGFNLRLAKLAKKAGVKVLYYISPKVWAWNQKRVKTIKKCVDMMAVIFPFEVDFYKKWQVPVKFVGNPLLDLTANRLSLEKSRQLFNINSNDEIIGLFPGSRTSEIKRLLPIMLDAAKVIKKHNPNIKFLLPQASSISDELLQPYIESSSFPIQVIKNNNYDVMQVCDAIIAASGTVTLEIALVETPLVIIYNMPWLEYQVAKRVIKIPFVGLCNILFNKEVAKELLQHDATPEKIAQEIEKILSNKEYRDKMTNEFKSIRKSLENEKEENISDVVSGVINN